MIKPHHILSWVALLLPFATWCISRTSSDKSMRCLVYPLLTFVCAMALFAIAGVLVERDILREIASFDLDGDGSITGDEVSPASEEAELRWSSDVGRNFAPIIGPPIFAIWILVVYSLCSLAWHGIQKIVRLVTT